MTIESDTVAGSPPPHLLDLVARRFPLVPRRQPPCRPLDVRLARVRALADQAVHLHPQEQALTRAAEAHNLAALILSDCGLPDEARHLCWRQHTILRQATPASVPVAKLILQSLINLARLHIRDGDGANAHHILDGLFHAVSTQTDVTIDGQTVDASHLVHTSAAHRELTQWIWTVLLADGTRALARAGRWHDAVHHVQHHHGIGQRLLDGRQAAILAHCTGGDTPTATDLLATSAPDQPWEHAVAACLTVVNETCAARDPTTDTATMVQAYLNYQPEPEHELFHARLGLAVAELTATGHSLTVIADVVRQTLARTDDAYLAREALASANLLGIGPQAQRAFIDRVRAAALGAGNLPDHRSRHLMESIATSETAITHALSQQAELI